MVGPHEDYRTPTLPGLVFGRLIAERSLPLLTIPGVLHLVGNRKTPVPIDDAEIAAIRRAVESGLVAEPWPFLQVGQKVCLEEGPLAGLEGILLEAQKESRIVVSVILLQRSVAVVIERHWARPVDLKPRPTFFVPVLEQRSGLPA